MAQLTFPVTKAGLVVPVWIGWARNTTAALVAAGQPVAAPLGVRGLLDTGADVTAVATWILQRLAIPAATRTSTHTAAGPVRVNLYEVSLTITDPSQPAGAPWLTEPNLTVTELAATLPDADVLVGLDVLLKTKLVLDGPGRWFTLEC